MSLIRQHIYLIGPKAIESLTTLNQLPTKRQVLSRFHYYLSELKKNRTACHRTIEEVLIVWNKAAIPTKQNYHCVGKLEKVHTEWLLLKKNNKRALSSQKEKESVFSHNLDKLFDIAHMNAFTLINIDEDRTFLKDQRTDRKMIITTEDKEVSQRQARSLKRHNTEKERQQRHVQNSAEAPEGDLNLWLLLDKYSSIDPQISATAKERLERHLWYLSDELVGLALFSDKVSDEDKHSLANAIVSNSCATTRMVRGNAALLNKNSKLCDFANGRSKNLLKYLRIDDEFLRQPPQTWKELDTYLQGKKCVSNLRVVNDTAERGIKLFTDYQKLLTDDEDEKQFLLQVVEQNRKLIPTKSTKASIIKAVSQ